MITCQAWTAVGGFTKRLRCQKEHGHSGDHVAEIEGYVMRWWKMTRSFERGTYVRDN